MSKIIIEIFHKADAYEWSTFDYGELFYIFQWYLFCAWCCMTAFKMMKGILK